jgi:Cu/Ag efflux protein CusF
MNKPWLAIGTLAAALAAQAQPSMSDGEVRKIDAQAGKLTLRHGGIRHLDMPPMTMVFRVRDPAWLKQVQPGDKVGFTAEMVGGQATVTSISTAAR